MSAYLESLVANDPSIAPMADDVREQVAAVHAVMEEQGTQILFAARLQVEALSYECIQQGVLSAIARCAEYEDRGRNLPGCPPYICRDWANR